MASRTIQTPAALRRDTRFQACSPGAKWVFGHLCDRREVVAEPGHDVLGTVVLIVEGLGDTPREALAPLLLELERDRGLVTVEADRLVIHSLETPADRQGPRGGKVGAVRTAEYRARLAARVTVRPVTVTDSVTSHDPSQVVGSDGCDGSIRHVTGNVTDNPSQNPSRDGGSNGFVGDGPSPEVPSPHSPLSPTPTPPNENRAREGSPAPTVDAETAARLQRLADLEAAEALRVAAEAEKVARAAKRAERKKTATHADTIPLAGTLAFAVYQAIVTDPALEPITRQCPGDFATRITNPLAHPGVDVLATVLAGAEYVARNPGKYTDGRRFLTNQLRERPVRNDPTKSGAFPRPVGPPATDRFGRPRAALPPSARDVIARQQASLSLPTKPEVPRVG